jgi:dehydrogenase/reductase SDR family protein 4
MYAVSKTALLGLTKALAEELAPAGLRVNCVAPGVVPTKFAAALVATPEAEAGAKARTLVGRLGTPADIAAAVAFLASGDAGYVTGETLVVAGGMQSRL